MTFATAPRVLVGAVFTESGKPHAFSISIDAANDADRAAVLDTFPKFCKVRPSTWICLEANKATGTRNETGERRARRILDTLTASGVAFEWDARFSNSYPTPAAFLAAIN